MDGEDDEDGCANFRDREYDDDDGDDQDDQDNENQAEAWRSNLVNPEKLDIKALFAGEKLRVGTVMIQILLKTRRI
jgi:hypothetical protein